MIKHIGVVSIPVSDPDRSKRFYVESLGFECLADTPMGPTMRWLQVAPPGAATSIALVTWFEAMKPGSIAGLVFEVDDVPAAHAELTARGVSFEGEPFQGPGGWFAVFTDPDGNRMTLHQSGT